MVNDQNMDIDEPVDLFQNRRKKTYRLNECGNSDKLIEIKTLLRGF